MTTRESFERFLDEYPILKNASRVAVAFSGGADSLALLYTLKTALPELEVIPIYVNHNIRSTEELDAEISLNRKNCSSMKLELVVKTIPRGEVDKYAQEHSVTSEAAARALRYNLLEEEDVDYILTAHTLSDHIELLVMRLLTGSSLKALVGIRPKRGRILRPLIYSRREDTEACCYENQIEYACDSTNDTDFCFRNRVRHNISSLLSSKAIDSLLNISNNLRIAEERDKDIAISRNKLFISINRNEYLSSGPFGRNNALEDIYSTFEVDRMSESQKKELENVILKRGRAYFKHFIAIGSGETVCFYRRLACFSCLLCETLPYGLSLTKCDDVKALSFTPTDDMFLRLSEEGDTIKLSEGEKKVSSLLSEYKLPYAFVVDSPNGIVALFSSLLGGRDRLCRDYLKDRDCKSIFWSLN